MWFIVFVFFEAMFSGLGGLFVCWIGDLFLVGLLCGDKHTFRYHQAVCSLVLFVDVTELPAVSLGFPDKYILFAFCC